MSLITAKLENAIFVFSKKFEEVCCHRDPVVARHQPKLEEYRSGKWTPASYSQRSKSIMEPKNSLPRRSAKLLFTAALTVLSFTSCSKVSVSALSLLAESTPSRRDFVEVAAALTTTFMSQCLSQLARAASPDDLSSLSTASSSTVQRACDDGALARKMILLLESSFKC